MLLLGLFFPIICFESQNCFLWMFNAVYADGVGINPQQSAGTEI